jgi:hypothetical protein
MAKNRRPKITGAADRPDIPAKQGPKTADAHRFGPEASPDARFYSAFSAKRSDAI